MSLVAVKNFINSDNKCVTILGFFFFFFLICSGTEVFARNRNLYRIYLLPYDSSNIHIQCLKDVLKFFSRCSDELPQYLPGVLVENDLLSHHKPTKLEFHGGKPLQL